MTLLCPLILAGVAAAALGEITNPTGDCVSDYDDPQSTTRGAVHVPDCNNPLKREYWRVFLRDEREDGVAPLAAMLPRPDGMGTNYGLCDDNELFQTYALCAEMSAEKINNIPLGDALEIAHTLHGKLVFEAGEYGEDYWGVSPHAKKEDIYAVCEMGLATDNVLAHCQALMDLCDEDGACMDMAIVPNEATVKDLALALNELYGAPAAALSREPVAQEPTEVPNLSPPAAEDPQPPGDPNEAKSEGCTLAAGATSIGAALVSAAAYLSVA